MSQSKFGKQFGMRLMTAMSDTVLVHGTFDFGKIYCGRVDRKHTRNLNLSYAVEAWRNSESMCFSLKCDVRSDDFWVRFDGGIQEKRGGRCRTVVWVVNQLLLPRQTFNISKSGSDPRNQRFVVSNAFGMELFQFDLRLDPWGNPKSVRIDKDPVEKQITQVLKARPVGGSECSYRLPNSARKPRTAVL